MEKYKFIIIFDFNDNICIIVFTDKWKEALPRISTSNIETYIN
jgi:hypothetical protein